MNVTTRLPDVFRFAVILLLIALVPIAARIVSAEAAAPLEGTRPAQWRVTWKSDPAHQATVSWSTAGAGKSHRVHFRSADGSDEGVVDCHTNGRFQTGGSNPPELYYHHALLKELSPATRYTLVLQSDDDRSPELQLVTAPDDDRPLALLFGGDSRSGREARQKVNRMLGAMVAERPEIVALAHGGDFIASGASLAQWSAWMSDHELTATPDGRLLPIIPARGNHDGGELFNQVFDFPHRDKNYYALDLGAEVRFITLNTDASTGGDQAKWLEAELARSRPGHRWLLAQYHKPAYPAVKFPSGAKANWVPLFEKYGVDLVCEADGHTIKRTPPIRGDRIDPTGVVYIGEGGLGVGQRSPRTSRWYLKAPGKTGKGHHVQLLSFQPDRLEYQTILLGGDVFDKQTFKPRAPARARQPAAKPVAVGAK